jgi:hypothetical protein
MARSAPLRLTRRPAAIALCLLLARWCVGPALAAQAAHCDADLQAPPTNPLGYRLRGDRCEGIYFQEVGATVLRLVSFTQSYENFDPTIGRPLVLEWTPLTNQELHVRAQSLKNRVYYRMDSDRPAGTASFDWPLDLLQTLRLEKNDLGIVAWTVRPLGGKDRMVHVPLRIRQRSAIAPGPYRLVLMPGVQVEELFISMAAAEPSGESGASLIDKQPLGFGYYPAGRAIVVPLPVSAATGVYRVSIGATLTQGGASAMTLYFSHSM